MLRRGSGRVDWRPLPARPSLIGPERPYVVSPRLVSCLVDLFCPRVVRPGSPQLTLGPAALPVASGAQDAMPTVVPNAKARAQRRNERGRYSRKLGLNGSDLRPRPFPTRRSQQLQCLLAFAMRLCSCGEGTTFGWSLAAGLSRRDRSSTAKGYPF
jgi:hypothetical protein